MALSPRLHVNERVDTVYKDWIEPDLRKYTWQVAQDTLAEERAKGFDEEPIVITDGRYRADPRQVKLYGKIEFVARQNVADAVKWILAELVRRSPYLGTQPYIYRDSHVVMVNGASISDLRQLENLRPGDKVQIVNTVPYARKIEGATAAKEKVNKRTGKVTRQARAKRRGSSSAARNGVYRPVYAIAKQRFGRVMFVDYKMVRLDLGVRVWGKQGGGKNARRVLRDQVYPAIQISQGRAITGYN